MATSNTERSLKRVKFKGLVYTFLPWQVLMEINGEAYQVHENADEELVRALHIMTGKKSPRVTIIYGDLETGVPSPRKPASGFIRKSAGAFHILTMENTKKTRNGLITSSEMIPTGQILAIKFAKKTDGGWIYQHPNYKGEK